MIIFKEAPALHLYLDNLRARGHSVGFVPTMGALHQGHLSLIRQCRGASDVTVCSIFVNPTQFNDPADFTAYPITTANDIRLLVAEGTDVLFLPAVDEIYPAGTTARQHYNLGYLETILEGAHRPGHFQGVCQVVHRLLDIVVPDLLFLGQKDFQQCMVLRQLLQLLQLPVKLVIGDTLRESSGLAMSSRNLRLSDTEKLQAAAIYECLAQIEAGIGRATVAELTGAAKKKLLDNGFQKIDYVAIAEAENLRLLDDAAIPGRERQLVALVAAFIGGVRLIDNKLLNR